MHQLGSDMLDAEDDPLRNQVGLSNRNPDHAPTFERFPNDWEDVDVRNLAEPDESGFGWASNGRGGGDPRKSGQLRPPNDLIKG